MDLVKGACEGQSRARSGNETLTETNANKCTRGARGQVHKLLECLLSLVCEPRNHASMLGPDQLLKVLIKCVFADLPARFG